MATAELRAKVTADATQFVSEIARTKTAMSSLPKSNVLGSTSKDFDGASAAGKRFAESFAESRRQAIGLQTVMQQLGPYFTGAAIVGAVRSTMAFADAISDGAARIGVSTTEYQRWQVAAATSGTTIEKVETQVQRLSTILGGDITAKQEAAFARLGLSVKQLKDMEPAEAFNAVAAALSNLTDPYARAAAAGELFGKKAAAGIAQFAEGLKEARANITNLVTEEDIAKVARMQDAWDSLILTVKRFAVNRFASAQAYGEELGNLSTGLGWTGAAQNEIAARFGGMVKTSTTPNLDRAEKAAAAIPQETAKAAEKRLQSEMDAIDVVSQSIKEQAAWELKSIEQEQKASANLASLKEDRERALQEIKRKGQENEARAILDNARKQADLAKTAFENFANANRRFGVDATDYYGTRRGVLGALEFNRKNRSQIASDRLIEQKVQAVEQGYTGVRFSDAEKKRVTELQVKADALRATADMKAAAADSANVAMASLPQKIDGTNQRLDDLNRKIDELSTARAG